MCTQRATARADNSATTEVVGTRRCVCAAHARSSARARARARAYVRVSCSWLLVWASKRRAVGGAFSACCEAVAIVRRGARARSPHVISVIQPLLDRDVRSLARYPRSRRPQCHSCLTVTPHRAMPLSAACSRVSPLSPHYSKVLVKVVPICAAHAQAYGE